MADDLITVTRPSLPDLEKLQPLLEEIWKSGRLTNGGRFHEELEARLCEYLGVEHLSLFTNGTIALVTALQAMRVTGEVITTPYTFAATPHALLWNKLKPVFVDIEPDSFNLDASKIEAAITPETTAILPVHCYGTPANIDEIQRIADLYGLHVIYDAAHAFAVRYRGRSLLEAGDISVLSFHATKVFNTFEGGALILKDKKTKQRVDYLKNFGFANETTVVAPGINGKMNEFQAALGLLQLEKIDSDIRARQSVYRKYREELIGIEGLQLMEEPVDTEWNYSYCPVLVNESFPLSRDDLYSEFRKQGILVRRYFYPLVSDFPMYFDPSAVFENAADTAQRILCLPIYSDLNDEDFGRIMSCLREAANGHHGPSGSGQ